MKHAASLMALLLGLLAPAWAADEVASAPAAAAPARPIFIGQPGDAPVQVAFAWLADRVADEHGLFEYQKLDIRQGGKGEVVSSVDLALVMDGLLDDAVKSQRYQLKLSFVDNRWQIDAARQDWTCRRGGKAWTQRPCK
ncbi:hypothetical protein [Chitinilyticum litopenaei]|uniref:hypothetical protein n=1 Tax=Chitinilyticum litopenaei TaxID=1121276 RepID=UPI00040E8F70|nr:hypothetical protein [Chitinilyticum litopenaei]